ncbi:MAG TPA: Gfo/Idh/MocA family oxidoreductase [Geobacteraceae bacterium]|nr:Gfo/Idh/MocA family oxidoreductase [Geobacteraceae bacterium]
MKRIRAAVIGVGYLGKFHAEKYASLPEVELVGVADSDAVRAAEVSAAVGAPVFSDYRDLAGRVDLVSIVVPTRMHYEVASFFLGKGIHVLLEKPITTTVKEAVDLISIADSNGLVLQVGHLERFNPALQAVRTDIVHPGFIDAIRVAPYKPRGTDVSVVLDLMVHDLDIISTLINSKIASISASGASVFSREPDIANARIEFVNGATANVTASRVSPKSERRMLIFQEDAFISVDFQNRKSAICRKGEGESAPGVPAVISHEIDVPQKDQILAEITAFIDSVKTKSAPVVTGVDGMRALEIALLVEEKVRENLRLLGSSK